MVLAQISQLPFYLVHLFPKVKIWVSLRIIIGYLLYIIKFFYIESMSSYPFTYMQLTSKYTNAVHQENWTFICLGSLTNKLIKNTNSPFTQEDQI